MRYKLSRYNTYINIGQYKYIFNLYTYMKNLLWKKF